MSAKNSPKHDVRLAAREQAAAVRAAQLKKDKRNRMIAIGVLVLAVLALGLAIFFINKQGEAKPLADTAAPATATENGGFAFGKDRVAGTDNGSDAVELSVYLDFQCSFCAAFEIANSDSINEMLEAEDITLVLHPVSILGTSFSQDTAGATAYLAEKAPEHVLDFVNAVFLTNPSENGAPSNEQLEGLAVAAGVDEGVAKKMFNGDWKKWVAAATDHAINDESLHNSDGNFGTPTILIDGERFDGWNVDGQLAQAVAAAKEAKSGN